MELVHKWEDFKWNMLWPIYEATAETILPPASLAEKLLVDGERHAQKVADSLNSGTMHQSVTWDAVTFSYWISGDKVKVDVEFKLTGQQRLVDVDATLAAHKGAI